MKQTPNNILSLAATRQCNVVEFVQTINGERIYSIGAVDEEGLAIPMGLPMFIIEGKDGLRIVDGYEGLELHNLICL